MPPIASDAGQLALPFRHVPRYADTGFIAAGSNHEAATWLRRPGDWPQGRLAIWGPGGCGKTHLLRVWAEREKAAVVAGRELTLPPPSSPLAVDDAADADEQVLLHTLNAVAEAGGTILLASRDAPARWPTGLPDLASRLRALTAVEIGPAEDDLLATLLSRLLTARQLAVAEPLQVMLLRCLPRTAAAMRDAAELLDVGSLAAGRRITRPLVARVIGEIGGADPTETEANGLQASEHLGARPHPASPPVAGVE